MCIHCETGEDADCQCDVIYRLRSEIARLREERQGFLTPDEIDGLMRVGGFLALSNVQKGASIVFGILERNGFKPVPMMSPLPPGPEGDA
jgi:hypothetical protein